MKIVPIPTCIFVVSFKIVVELLISYFLAMIFQLLQKGRKLLL